MLKPQRFHSRRGKPLAFIQVMDEVPPTLIDAYQETRIQLLTTFYSLCGKYGFHVSEDENEFCQKGYQQGKFLPPYLYLPIQDGTWLRFDWATYVDEVAVLK